MRPRWTDDKLRRLREMTAQGYSAKRCAGLLGVSDDAVYNARKAHGMKSPHDRDELYRRDPVARETVFAPILQYRDTTARVLGDPPIGRSALDKRAAQ